jgi:photosystem II stability/assembly factor-like uncharacterized protein
VTEETSTTQDFIYCFAASAKFDQEKGGVCFAARNAGLFRSDDSGATWSLATEALGLSQEIAVTAVALPQDFERDHSVLCGLAGGLLLSGDGGKTWSLPTIPPPPPMVTALALSPAFSESGVALAATMQDGVLRSADGGRTWISWNFGLLDLNVLCLAMSPAFLEDETVLAGTETGIFRSTNGGRAWREVELPVDYDPVLCLALSPSFAQDGILYAGTETQGLLVSRDAGLTWRRIADRFLDEPVNGIVMSGKKGAEPEVIALSSGAAWLSRDGGENWAQLWAELAEADQEISALYAPRGFSKGSPAWLGLYGGNVVKKKF